MKTNKDIQSKVQETFEALDVFQEVKVSPFFKDKTMQRLFSEKEEKQLGWSWFTPKLQLATLVCFVVLNVLALRQYSENKYDTNINEFAETYGLQTTETEISLFN
ncbi:hypothetical protein [Yeosuana sp.]|uniref:hypothetical protein n=1 Tax=Yeosuana sp. TaxID=2529388 RepID=UPI0040552A4D